MARKRKEIKSQILFQPTKTEPDDLREYVAEAEQVDLMARHPGWDILRRDFDIYRNEIGSKIAYLNPKSLEFEEARILYIAIDKLIKSVEDYRENKRRAIELLEKIDNPKENIILDVDTG